MTNKTNQKPSEPAQDSKRPTHLIYQVIGEGEKARWNTVGAAWANKDGKGLSLKFDAYPVSGRVVVRQAPAKDETAEGGRGQ